MNSAVKPILVFTWGNPSRGDDALGPRLYELLLKDKITDVELLTDFQLQIEHSIDLQNRERILFVDAGMSASAPFEFHRVFPDKDNSFTTHAMSPQALLDVYQGTQGQEPPPSYMLSIRGYEFSLGEPLSKPAEDNLRQAHEFALKLIKQGNRRSWDKEQT